ncbi:hypothetical protein VUR80DRAFT_5147 [Thermomyces stellatus]
MDGQKRPALRPILRRVVDSPCNMLLLNESGDRLIRRNGNDCELWELRSGTRLATRNLWRFWDGHSGQPKDCERVLLPLIQHPTEPDWLLCVNTYMPRPVALLSWGDFTLRMGSTDEEFEVAPRGSSTEPFTELSLLRRPTRPDRLTALIHGLELLVPVPSRDDFRSDVWRACFVQYTLACAAEDACFRTVHRFFKPMFFIPIAFLSASRTLVFLTGDLWIFSMQVGHHIALTADDEARPRPPQVLSSVPPWRSGSGAFAPSCAACGQSHPISALRHIHASFAPHPTWQCFWADGGTAPDGRRKMDFSFWGPEPTDRIIVADALRYADEVEWVEYRNEAGQVWKRDWKLVEGAPEDGDSKTARVV